MAKAPTRQSSKDTKSKARKTAPRKTPAKTSTKVKASAKAQPIATKRETLLSLREHVDRVEARLKRADTLTRKSIKAIETSFDALSQKANAKPKRTSQRLTKAQTVAIDRHVSTLADQLTDMVTQTRTSVNRELRRAISNPSLGQLKTALQIADDRIAEADDKLARSIAGINRHIADMALAVDARLKEQSEKQDLAVADLRSESEKARYALIQRLDKIEDESAAALHMIGDKVASTTELITLRSKAETETLTLKFTELAAQSKADFKTLKKDLKSRVQALEADKTGLESERAREFSSLESRLEGLEFGLNSLMKAATNGDTQALGAPIKPETEGPNPSEPETSPISVPSSSAFGTPLPPLSETAFTKSTFQSAPISAKPSLGDETTAPSAVKGQSFDAPAFSQSERTEDSLARPLTPNTPASTPELESDPYRETAERVSIFGNLKPEIQAESPAFKPSETVSDNPYDTSRLDALMPELQGSTAQAYSYSNTSGGTGTLGTQAQGLAYDPSSNLAYAQSPQRAPQTAPDLTPQPFLVHSGQPQEFVAPPMPAANSSFDNSDLPYENPAYADPNYNANANGSLARARPGSFDKKKPSKLKGFKLPSLTDRNKRTMMMAVGVTAISLVGLKVLTSNDGATPAQLNAQNQISTDSEVPAFIETGNPDIDSPRVNTSEPIGQYADNRAPADSNKQSLESAAELGDPVAQFQLGLSYLQNGRRDEALQLIRGSADSGLAAAQYRLAKLYEVGEGVVEDPVMARSLTERAARSGNRIAMHDLALYYAEGRGGVDLDMVTAAKWFEKAAERGVVDSQFNLGVLYESGQGLPQNLTDAYVWYAIASDQGDQLAGQRIEVLSNQLSSDLKETADARVANFKPTRIDNKANGIFKNLPWNSQPETSKAANQILKAQGLLTDLGYDAGSTDGAMGPKTRTAIISFERANSMPETGRVSVDLIDRLSLAAGA